MTVKYRVLIFIIALSLMLLPVSASFAALPSGLFVKDAEAELKEAESIEEVYFEDDFKNGLNKWSTIYQMGINVENRLETTNDRSVCKVVSTTDFEVGNLILEYDLKISNPASNFMHVTDLRYKDKADSSKIILYKDRITVIPVNSVGVAKQVYSSATIEDDIMYTVRIKLIDDTLSYELKKADEKKFKKLFETGGVTLN